MHILIIFWREMHRSTYKKAATASIRGCRARAGKVVTSGRRLCVFTCALCPFSCLLPSHRSAEPGCHGRRYAPFLTGQTWLSPEMGLLFLETKWKKTASVFNIQNKQSEFTLLTHTICVFKQQLTPRTHFVLLCLLTYFIEFINMGYY